MTETAVLIGLYGPKTPKPLAEEHLDELALLADTAGARVTARILQARERPDISTYLGKGKLEELKKYTEAEKTDLVIVDDDLSPTQARNIEKATQTKVLDRSGLILAIFASRAKSAAAKTQVELAQLEYLLPRLTRIWTHLSRQKGGIGTKGPGETQIETDRRLIGKRIATLKEKLVKLSRQRATQRKGREAYPRVALVGYTNAGKSTLMNLLVDAGVHAENRLFATLDATVRRYETAGTTFLLSDTVGFIRKLPHGLVESFKSTLDEIREADLLLHVVDAGSDQARDHIRVVRDTLKEIGADDKPEILIFNQVDKIDDPERIADLRETHPDGIFLSALRGIGLGTLEEALLERVRRTDVDLDVELAAADGKALARLHKLAEVHRTDYVEDRVRLQVTVPEKHLAEIRQLTHVHA